MMQCAIDLARSHNWLAFHDNDSRRNEPGFPDLVLAKPGRAPLFIEFKLDGQRMTDDQEDWGRALDSWLVTPQNFEYLLKTIREEPDRQQWAQVMEARRLRRIIRPKKRKVTIQVSATESATVQTHMVWSHKTMCKVKGRKGKFRYFGHSTSKSGTEEITVYGPMVVTDDRLIPYGHAKYHTFPAEQVEQA